MSCFASTDSSRSAFDPSYEAFLERVHPDDRADVDARNHKAFADHQPFEDVKRVTKSDGSVFLMRTQGEVVCDDDGNPLRMVGVCEDVTGAGPRTRGRVDARAQSSSPRTTPSTRSRAAARSRSWNPAAERMFGYTAAETVGEPVTRLLTHEGADTHERDRWPPRLRASVSSRSRRRCCAQRPAARRGLALAVGAARPRPRPDRGRRDHRARQHRAQAARAPAAPPRRPRRAHRPASTGAASTRSSAGRSPTRCASARAPPWSLIDIDDFKYVNDSARARGRRRAPAQHRRDAAAA